MKAIMRYLPTLLVLLTVPGLCRAQTAAVVDSAADANAIKPRFYGYTGVYYGYDFNVPRTRTRPGFVYSENRHNEVSINIALLGARFANDRVRGTFAIQTGTYPDANYAAEPQVFKHIYEAYAGVRLRERLWLDAGVFLSHIGLEGPISRDDLTLTRSILADNSPYYEAGAKLTYDTPNGHWTFVGLVLNGWQVIRDQNENMSTGWQVQWKPTDKWVVNSSSYAGEGPNQPDSVGRQLRYFHNLYATYQPTEKLKVAASFDVGAQRRLSSARYDQWQAAAVLFNQRVGAKTAINGRLEYFRDPAHVLIPRARLRPEAGFTIGAASLGFDYFPVPRCVVRLEGKTYHAQQGVFERDQRAVSNSTVVTTLLGLTF
jgi:Putative beta-barrel porin-2, OmpL-like. bbp2